jgi:mannose-6-phosphate isomerase
MGIMTVHRLPTIRVEKPWGRHQLWPGFANPAPDGAPVGEIWYAAPPGVETALMVKYLFTSERLSIQVHPDDAAAQAAGYACGKDEAWVVLAAEPGATIALGTTRAVSQDALRSAALDGSIETLMHWQSVKAGDVIYSPAGVVHAIGPGLTLIEVQQNLDLTYRLYDYGRPRELHLDAGIAVSKPVPFVIEDRSRQLAPGRELLTLGAKFTIERWSNGFETNARDGWFIPVTGNGTINGETWHAGECYMIDADEAAVHLDDGAGALFAYVGSVVRTA